MDIIDAAGKLESLGNPTRLALYRLLVRAGHSGLAVGEIQQKLQLAQSTLSFHLKALIVAGLVTQERQSRNLICRANFERMTALLDFLAAECCADETCERQSTDAA